MVLICIIIIEQLIAIIIIVSNPLHSLAETLSLKSNNITNFNYILVGNKADKPNMM